MRSLLLKEYFNMRWLVIWFGVLSAAFGSHSYSEGSIFTYPFIFVIIYLQSFYGFDNKNNSHIIIASLPVSRVEIVVSRYLSSLLAWSGIIGISWMCRVFVNYTFHTHLAGNIFIDFIIVCVILSIGIPMFEGFNPRIVVASMMTLLILFVVFLIGVFSGIDELVKSNIFLCVLALTSLVLSVMISLSIYKEKEF